MKAVIQRVSYARVEVDGELIASIEQGLLILLGISQGDTEKDVMAMAKKCAQLRIFSDEAGKMNLNVEQIGGKILLVSQFTLCANTRKGNRPSFVNAMAPEDANRLVELTAEILRNRGIEVEQGRFGADMKISLLNDGPVTIPIEVQEGKVI